MQKLISKFSFHKDKIVFKNILATFSIKGIALVVSFLSLPAYISYLDNQMVLGVWFTLLSIFTWLLTFDFGIGNGLRNKLVDALVEENNVEVKRKISSAYFIIGIITLLFTFIGIIVFRYMNFNSIFNISTSVISNDLLKTVVVITFISICLQFFLRTINFILYSLQMAAINSLTALITSISQYLFILFVPYFSLEENLLILSVSSLIFINLPLLLVSIYVFSTKIKGCKPNYKFVNKKDILEIGSLGGIFFWNQIMYTAIVQSNLFIITSLIGPSSVIEYEIYYKIFMLLGIFISIAISPIWSAITKAYKEKDILWINKYFTLLSILIVSSLLVQIILIYISPILFKLWLGNNFTEINYMYASFFALYGVLFIFQSIVSTFACGLGKMKLQSICYTVAVVCKVIVLIMLSASIDNWSIIILIDIVILLPYCIAEWISIKRFINKKLLSGSLDK